MSYNGWKNRETWAVALWIDNEEGSYRARRELTAPFVAPEDPEEWKEDDDYHVEHDAQDCPGKTQHPLADCAPECDHKERVHNVRGFADAIEEWITSEMIPDLDGLAGDLLSYSLSGVDWYEIAENWLSEED